MKKITILTFMAMTAAVIFTACGEENKNTVEESDATKTSETVVKKTDPFGNPIPETNK
jgi:ABC-type glycerol-3-phosphate transport system substrate-binding protein